MRFHGPFLLIPPALAVLTLASPALAQIVTDGTLGPRATLTGPAMTIGAELGTTRGTNLFHSFQDFNIQAGETATFTGPDRIQNVIGRVTGGRASSIDGTLRSTVGQADVYLVNPSGVVLGPDARVDVPASLHVSTADELRFQDGSRFSAREPAASTLTVAAPESFGFLSPQPAELTITGSQLAVRPGKTLTLTAGDVAIVGAVERRASLQAPGGTLRVEAPGAAGGVVPVAQPSTAPGLGTLSIEQADLETSGDGGGLIALRAGTATLNDAILMAENQGVTASTGGIDLAIQGTVMLNGSRVATDTIAPGRGGMTSIHADVLRMDAALITSDTYQVAEDPGRDPVGNAGTVIIEVAHGLELLNGAVISSSTGDSGHAGQVDVRAGDIQISNGSAIMSSTAFADGMAGQVIVQAGAMRIDGNDQGTGIASISDLGSTGHAGSIEVKVDGLLELLNGAQITSATFANGDGGNVRVTAGELQINGTASSWTTGIISEADAMSMGRAGNLVVEVAGLLALNDGMISASTFSPLDAGSITVNAGTLTIRNTATIASLSATEGDAGDISIRAENLFIDSQDMYFATAIFSSALLNSTGNAGNILLNVGHLELANGGTVSTDTFGQGNAGDIVIHARNIDLHGWNAGWNASITSRSGPAATGQVGDITIEAEVLALRNAGEISIAANQDTPATVDAGGATIQIDANELRLETGSRVTTESRATTAGAIRIAGGWLWLQDSQITTSANGATGDGGDIVLDSRQIILDGGFVQANTAAPGARGGDIRVDSAVLIASQGQVEIGGLERQTFGAGGGRNIIQAAAPGGESGTIAVTAPAFDISASVTPLAAPLANPDDLLADACRVARGARPSTLVDRGLGGAPPAPAASLPLGAARLKRILGQ